MKIQASHLQFQSQNQRQSSSLQLGGRALRATAPTLNTPGPSRALVQPTGLRRSLETLSQSQHTQQSVATSAEGQTQLHASASSTQSGLRRFVEQQGLTFVNGMTLPSAPTPGSQQSAQQYFLHESTESTVYQLQGDIALEDGRNIRFNITGNMSRSLRIEEGSGVYSGKIVQKDPLILNLGSATAQLTESAFRFDIDNDGKADEVSFATQGSAFLFIDRNQNGTLDDGSELFGTQSGDGFADLAQYDDDANGYIDNNDAVYQQLKLLSRDEQGNDSITSLAGANVGALGLHAVSTEFELTNDWQQSRGRLRATGVAVGDDGRVMTLQQVDLTQREPGVEREFREHFEAPVTNDDALQGTADAPTQAIQEALDRLRDMTEKMQDAMKANNAGSDNAAPKSLLEMLVDRFFPSEEAEGQNK